MKSVHVVTPSPGEERRRRRKRGLDLLWQNLVSATMADFKRVTFSAKGAYKQHLPERMFPLASSFFNGPIIRTTRTFYRGFRHCSSATWQGKSLTRCGSANPPGSGASIVGQRLAHIRFSTRTSPHTWRTEITQQSTWLLHCFRSSEKSSSFVTGKSQLPSFRQVCSAPEMRATE